MCTNSLNFFVNSGLNWGVELMRFNDKVEDNVARFTHEQYNPMFDVKKNENLSVPNYPALKRKEWKVVNFIPETLKCHQIQGLWNVVVSEDFKVFTIYDDDGKVIESIKKQWKEKLKSIFFEKNKKP